MQIHKAAAKGDKAAVLRELESGIPIDALDEENRSPLMVAVMSEESNVETMQLLLDKGANPNAVGGKYPRSVLLRAVYNGDLACVRCLLDGGADINLPVEGYLDVLTSAVDRIARMNDHSVLAMVEFLLERGASIQGSADGQTALSTAFDNGHFVVVKRLLEAGNNEEQLQLTPLMRAIALGTVDDVREQLEQGASLTDREPGRERTPWLLALSGGDIEKAKLLLAAGGNRDDVGHCGKTALIYPLEANHPEMLRWLLSIGCDVDATDEFENTALMEAAQQGSVPFVRLLLEAGADANKTDHINQKALAKTGSLEVVRLLLAVGQDLNDLSSDTRATLLGVADGGELVTSREDFEAGRLRRFGTSNPEKMDIPFWRAMVRSGVAAYTARARFIPEDKMYEANERTNPVWCYNRFGKSLNELPDGRFVEIGGEHEDWYDEDFCIYNEVFVHHPGGGFDIWGYPDEVFPPTDFHSATLVDGFIYIIGCIGPPEDRVVGYTPVYRLNTQTFAIEKVETSGENPGWIFRHKAIVSGDEIHISGGEVWNGPDSPEESAKKAADRAQRMAMPVREDFPSDDEWMEAFSQHLNDNPIEYYESPERFALDLKSFQWRRLS